ncbi:MAG: hypothetical protein JNK37_00245 [Verrucomicrobiales bacterium]|nr:hypothetical protein [Verrucomicrobiales bacterium]
MATRNNFQPIDKQPDFFPTEFIRTASPNPVESSLEIRTRGPIEPSGRRIDVIDSPDGHRQHGGQTGPTFPPVASDP